MRLPDFICIGAMRSGTTTLWSMLNGCSDIYMPQKKELHFFDHDYDEGLEYYAAYFEPAGLSQKCGEVTPIYLFMQECRDRLKSVVPNAKLVIILRDPVERAWSHYCFEVRKGYEDFPFTKALEVEEDRLAEGGYEEFVNFSYKSRGNYIDQLIHYEKAFSREQMLVIFLEDLKKDPEQVMAKVCSHIGVSYKPEAFDNLTHKNQTSVFPMSLKLHKYIKTIIRNSVGNSIYLRAIRRLAKIIQKRNLYDSSPKIPKEAYDNLKNYYLPFDERLEKWLGYSVPWNK